MVSEKEIEIIGDRIADKIIHALVSVFDRRFNAIDGRFNIMGQKFDVIDTRFNLIDKKFDDIDERFIVIDKRFDVVDNRFVAMDIRFDTVIDTMFETFATKDDIKDLKIGLTELRHTVDRLVTAVDGHTAVIEDLRMEYMSMGEQLSRHDRWIHQVAGKTQTILSFES